MSQVVTRAGAGAATDDKDKRQTDSPVPKDMKKKASNAEREKGEKSGAERQSEKTSEKSKEEPKVETNGKVAEQGKHSKEDSEKARQNGRAASADDEDALEPDADELFPELAYDEDEDGAAPDAAPGRSLTRRDQVKNTRTPETPRPPSEKQMEKDPSVNGDDNNAQEANVKDTKLLKLKEEVPASNRKLRSADRPAADDAREAEAEAEAEGERRGKLDTNYAKSRVKVSPYRRARPAPPAPPAADRTHSSAMADYSGDNTTMEMDVSGWSAGWSAGWAAEAEASGAEAESPYAALRPRARRSYKQLRALEPRRAPAAALRDAVAAAASASRPMGAVVGRKRRPAGEAGARGAEAEAAAEAEPPRAKRARAAPSLLQRLARPLRSLGAPLPAPPVARRAAPIVGINSDLPMSAPVAASDAFDPESLPIGSTDSIPTPSKSDSIETNKRCIVM